MDKKQAHAIRIKSLLPYLFVLLFVFSSKSIFSQSIQGKVVDNVSKAPIEFAYLVANDSLNFITGPDGSFIVNGMRRKSNIVLDFQMLGYQSKSIRFQLRFDTTLTIEMKEVPVILKDILVKERKQKPLQANEIVSIAIDSLNIKNKKSSIRRVSGFYSQTHFTIPLLNWGEKIMPNLDTSKTYHRLIQANLAVSYNSKVATVSILNVRRSNDFREYKYAYVKGKGRSFRSEYVSTQSTQEKSKATEREKELYDINGFFAMDPIANHVAKVKPEEKFYLKSGTYGYLNDDFTKHHSFKLEGVIDYGIEKVAKIKILPSSRSYTHGFQGRHHWIPVGYLFVRLSDFGIMRMEYSYILNPKEKDAWMSRALIGLPILFKDIILYKEVEGSLVLAYLNRFQKDIDVKRGDDEDTSKKRYYFVEREFVTSRFSSDPLTQKNTLTSIYDPYKYDFVYWEKAGIKSIVFKNYNRMVKDLESKGETLEDQFIKNSK